MAKLMPDYDTGNRAAAIIIMANPIKYAGIMTAWATLWMEVHQKPVTPRQDDTHHILPLFDH